MTQAQIDRELSRIKSWYKHNWPLCIFCNHLVKDGQLAHLIRRSYTRGDLQTLMLNTGLAHHDCHEMFDNNMSQAQYLPRMTEVLYIIRKLDQEYFNQIADHFPELAQAIAQFPNVSTPELSHHGELLSLQYLNQ
jgi:hypothetical protein